MQAIVFLVEVAADEAEAASRLQMVGAFLFGAVLGWFLYYLNRYRTDVGIGDLATVIGAVGGAGVLALFPAGTDLFGAYGIGLGVGFFAYFLVLVAMVKLHPAFDSGFFLDGRRKKPAADEIRDQDVGRLMGGNATVRRPDGA